MKWYNVVGRMMLKKRHTTDNTMLYIRGNDVKTDSSLKWNTSRINRNGISFAIDNRKFERFNDGQEILCYPMTDLPVRANVLDASLGGLRLRTREMVKINTNIGLVLCVRGRTTSFVVKVLWESKKQENYEYGVEFSREHMKDNKKVIEYISTLVSEP